MSLFFGTPPDNPEAGEHVENAPVGTRNRPTAAPVLSLARSDCCPAPAAFRVVLPADGKRLHSTELLMCQHHYRESATKLRAMSAIVFDEDGRML